MEIMRVRFRPAFCLVASMTQPRRIRPNRTWMITRRATRRHFIFRPDEDGMSQRIYWYTTAVIAAKFGIELHAVQVLSTHMHEVLTDVRGLLPAFLRERNRLLANAMKLHRRWPEEVFQRAPASCVELYGADSIAKQIGYTLANCVEAGLVHRPEDWPGVTVSVDDIGRRIVTVERPPMYFDPDNEAWPERAALAITMPKEVVLAHGDRARSVIGIAVREAVKRAAREARDAGRVVARSVKRLFTVSITRRSRSAEAFGKRNPTFAAAGNRERAREARAERASFIDLYRRALEHIKTGSKKGTRNALFPEGAWRWPRELCLAATMEKIRPVRMSV